jgi:uncharacterized protein YcfJ
LLLWVTLLCVLLGLVVSVPLGLAVVIVCVAVLIGAHVVGNALGTRLRDQAATRPRETTAASPPSIDSLIRPVAAALPVTSLRNKQRLSRTTPVVATVAAVAGAIVGGILLAWFNSPRGTLAGLVVGGLSCGFLGGFVGFLAGSFLEIFGPAWTEAASLAPDPPRRARMSKDGGATRATHPIKRFSRVWRWLARR